MFHFLSVHNQVCWYFQRRIEVMSAAMSYCGEQPKICVQYLGGKDTPLAMNTD